MAAGWATKMATQRLTLPLGALCTRAITTRQATKTQANAGTASHNQPSDDCQTPEQAEAP